MSSTSGGFGEGEQPGGAQTAMPEKYVLTKEETRVLRECSDESFWYRSLPLSLTSMVITKALIARGVLAASPRFGSIPKLAFACFCGHMIGKMSYATTCQEKLVRLENSPLADMLRQRTGRQPHKAPQSGPSDSHVESVYSMFQPAESPGEMSPNTIDHEYGFSQDPPMQTDKADDYSAPAHSHVEEDEEPKRKSIFYEDLRLKNRENYEVTLTQKAETLLKPSPEKEPKRPKIETKNIYGDTWEE